MAMHYLKKLDTKGFTLLEFIIVFSIAAVFLSFTPAFYRAFERHKLYSAASVMAEDIRLAQQLNINQDAVYTLLFDSVNERYFIQRDINTYKKTDLPGGVDLVATNFDFDNTAWNGCDNKLRFNTRGEPFRINGLLYGGQISLKDKNGEFVYIIVASITGRVRVDRNPPP
ncbi:pilus assembly FimT family protein [Pelotomaculum propionicicum]|uniref:pilus assembly FimT family protein n=1 Tax=Pelotomaculum propionicicum TaxID=258475 RepID=UPI003B77F6D3